MPEHGVYHVLHRNVVSTIVNLCIGVVKFFCCRCRCSSGKDSILERITGIYGIFVGKHENNIVVMESSDAFQVLIDRQGVGGVSIVEPVSRRADNDGVIGGVR